MQNPKRALVGFASLWMLLAAAMAAPVATFSGSFQLSAIIDPDPGDATFGFDLSPAGLSATDGLAASFGYLNVQTSSGDWLIQNQPIPLNHVVADEHNTVWFSDFGHVAGGTSVTLSAIINDMPYATLPVPDASWITQIVGPSTTPWAPPEYTGQSGPPVPAPAPVTPPPPPNTDKIEGFLRGGVADIKQYWNECGPTSTANSLIWLAKKYGFTKKLPRKADGSIDDQALILELAKIMHPFTPNNALPDKNGYKDRGFPGLNGNELKTGKEKYINKRSLPLVVEGGTTDPNANGANTFDFIKKELKKGQDVEFLIAWPNRRDGYHWVTVTGFIDAGKDSKSLIVHDPLLANGNNYWRINDDGTLTSPRGAAAWAVAESMPEPASLSLMGFAIMALAMVLWRRQNPTRPKK